MGSCVWGLRFQEGGAPCLFVAVNFRGLSAQTHSFSLFEILSAPTYTLSTGMSNVLVLNKMCQMSPNQHVITSWHVCLAYSVELGGKPCEEPPPQ